MVQDFLHQQYDSLRAMQEPCRKPCRLLQRLLVLQVEWRRVFRCCWEVRIHTGTRGKFMVEGLGCKDLGFRVEV